MTHRIETEPFGRTGHASARVIFGAAALGGMRQDRADAVLETLLEFGINPLDGGLAVATLSPVSSIHANDQWRIVLRWVEGHCHDVQLLDYHRG